MFIIGGSGCSYSGNARLPVRIFSSISRVGYSEHGKFSQFRSAGLIQTAIIRSDPSKLRLPSTMMLPKSQASLTRLTLILSPFLSWETIRFSTMSLEPSVVTTTVSPGFILVPLVLSSTRSSVALCLRGTASCPKMMEAQNGKNQRGANQCSHRHGPFAYPLGR